MPQMCYATTESVHKAFLCEVLESDDNDWTWGGGVFRAQPDWIAAPVQHNVTQGTLTKSGPYSRRSLNN